MSHLSHSSLVIPRLWVGRLTFCTLAAVLAVEPLLAVSSGEGVAGGGVGWTPAKCILSSIVANSSLASPDLKSQFGKGQSQLGMVRCGAGLSLLTTTSLD